MTTPQQQRGRKRLTALGVNPDDPQAVQTFYETERARYIGLAENGLHMAPTHALYGMLVQALKDAHGWDDLPDHWSSALIEWPTAEGRRRGHRGR